MKYWFYSEGNILGPYEPAELLALPAFAEESLVCPESATGDNPGDWRPASQTPEIAAAMSIGAGRVVTSGAASGLYEYETGFNPSVRYFEDREPGPSSSYGDLLAAIDGVLGQRQEAQPASGGQPAETDYELAEKFDIRLSRIQEELEAARWEKNLLLEKIRLKEMEEKKNQVRIHELEARLRGELEKSGEDVKELEQLRHLADLGRKAETLRQIEEIKKEELSLKEEAQAKGEGRPKEEAPAREEAPREEPAVPGPGPAAPAAELPPAEQVPPAVEPGAASAAAPRPLKSLKAEPVAPQSFAGASGQAEPVQEVPAPPAQEPLFQAGKPKTFKSIKPAAEIKLESALGKETNKDEGGDAGLTSRKLKSLGQTQHPAFGYGQPLPGPEPAPQGAFKPENLEPLPQQAGGLVYDFTVVATQPEIQRFRIEPRQENAPQQVQPEPRPVKPPTFDMGLPQSAPAPQAAAPQPAPALRPIPVIQPAGQPVQPAQQPSHAQEALPPFQFQPLHAAEAPAVPPAQPQASAPLRAEPAPSALPAAAKAPADSPEKTQRIPVPELKGKGKAEVPQKQAVKPRRGGKTAFIVIMVVFGSIAAGGLGYFFLGSGVSFSQFSMLNLGSSKKGPVMTSQLQQSGPSAAGQAGPGAAQQAPAVQQQQLPAAPQAPAVQPQEAQQPANDNIQKALDIVKNYKLSGGRGTISSWFANSFLTSRGGASEEWTATPLHGDILVVQYRLLRPRQEPVVYQFEVDASKNDIVRGINNNAIDLLSSPAKAATASAAPVRKHARKPVKRSVKAGKRSGGGEIPILPLPKEPAADRSDQAPSGFENPQTEPDQVKYLKAQESDEELF